MQRSPRVHAYTAAMSAVEDKIVETVFVFRNAACTLFPDETRLQIEVLILAAVRLLIEGGALREDAYDAAHEVLNELQRIGRTPRLALVP